jgi:hypothetical protein
LVASANVNELECFIKFSNEVGAAESIATRHNSTRARDVPDKLPADLMSAPAVLVRRDGHMLPLEPLYDSPQLGLVPHPGWRQDRHHLYLPPQALPGPLCSASSATLPRTTP